MNASQFLVQKMTSILGLPLSLLGAFHLLHSVLVTHQYLGILSLCAWPTYMNIFLMPSRDFSHPISSSAQCCTGRYHDIIQCGTYGRLIFSLVEFSSAKRVPALHVPFHCGLLPMINAPDKRPLGLSSSVHLNTA